MLSHLISPLLVKSRNGGWGVWEGDSLTKAHWDLSFSTYQDYSCSQTMGSPSKPSMSLLLSFLFFLFSLSSPSLLPLVLFINYLLQKKVLAVHGWMDNANTFDLVAPYLAAQGFTVVPFLSLSSFFVDISIYIYLSPFLSLWFLKVAIDLVGHGLSPHIGANCDYFYYDYLCNVCLLYPSSFPHLPISPLPFLGIPNAPFFYP